MKELSIEEKAKAYDEALEKAKNYHSPETVCNVRIAMENLFPELKESEDKRMKNVAIFLKSIRDKGSLQSTWKPSDEQIKGIECAIKTLHHQLNIGDNRLDSLYDDLKKLREE